MSLSKILQKSLYNYIDYGARSSKRINDLHAYIGSFLHNPQYEVSLVGRFNRKNVDIVADNVAYEVKLILSSYKKNSHNYLENLIGATTNLQLMGIETVQLIFIPTYLPNFTKAGNLKSIEYLGESQIQMYERLMALDSVVRPSKLIFQVFDTGNLEYLEQHVGTKLNTDDLKASYHVQLVTAKNSSISNFIARHSFESFIRSLDV